MDNEFSWEVYQADKRRAYSGAPLPTASVHVTSEEGGSEFIDVPASVGRRLAGLKQRDQIAPNSRQELIDVLDACTKTVAWEQLVRLFDRRDYSEKECLQKLYQAGFDHKLAHAMVQRGVQCGLVSNERYADSYIHSRIAAGWGMARIDRELANRGIQSSSLSGWPYEYLDPEDELMRAQEAASRKTVHEPNRYAKLVRFLIGRGFSYGVAAEAARSVLAD